MRWGTVVNAITLNDNQTDVEPQELLLAQLLTTRLVLIQANGNKLDEDDWQQFFGWLGVRLPQDIANPQFEDYRPALKGWLHEAVARVSPEETVDCLLCHLVTYIAELLQLDEIEQQLLMLAWLR